MRFIILGLLQMIIGGLVGFIILDITCKGIHRIGIMDYLALLLSLVNIFVGFKIFRNAIRKNNK